MFEYHEKILSHLERLIIGQEEAIQNASFWFGQTLIKDRLVHTFGTGHSHMIGLELFVRAGGLANVNAMLDSTVMTNEGARRSAEIERIPGIAKIIWDQHQIHPDDLFIIISNSGRNAMPLEMAMLAKEHGNKIVAITSKEQTANYPSRHASGKKLIDLADLILDNRVPSGDGLMRIDGNLTGPVSSISGMVLVNLIATEGMKQAASAGVKLPVYFSQNIDGFSNEELYTLYEDRIKHL
ncbi:MAG: SIS domain-containing protein [Cyclobacteriaceae bacterium]|nr:SIS domain-containing protein [Cyclobacteriaceae bacterium]